MRWREGPFNRILGILGDSGVIERSTSIWSGLRMYTEHIYLGKWGAFMTNHCLRVKLHIGKILLLKLFYNYIVVIQQPQSKAY